MIRLMLNLYKTITTSVYLFKYVKSSIYNKFMFRMLVLSAPNEKWVKNNYELNLWGGKMEVNVKFYMNVTIISVFRKMFYPQTILLYIRMNTCRLQRVTKSFFTIKCDALRDLVPLVQFKNREKHPWRSVNFSKVASWSLQVERFNLQINNGCFSRFLNCANGTKSRNAPQMFNPTFVVNINFKWGHLLDPLV